MKTKIGDKQSPAGSQSANSLEKFDYPLAPERIAEFPKERRGQSKLLVLNRKTGRILHRPFQQIERYFAPGDLLVVNDTKVMYSRLYGRKPTGGKVELLLLHEKEPGQWKGLVRNIGWQEENTVAFDNPTWEARVLAGGHTGVRDIIFNRADVRELMDQSGHMPLPPYIKRQDDKDDRTRYQTSYADKTGSAAAPTAGLHFTADFLDRLRDKGVKVVPITLHIGYGTFRLIDTPDIRTHKLHSEYYRISRLAARIINEGRARGGKVFAVGTTTVRTLEHASDPTGNIEPGSGWNDLYIHGSHRFKAVDHLLTNFHLPKSSLLVLASSFAGRQRLMRAYREAMKKDYRFFSYGDAMLIV